MVTDAMMDSDNQVFFDAVDEFLFKFATFLSNLLKICFELREQHQFWLRELNIPVIFTDKGLLQIRATHILQIRAFTDKGLIIFTDKVLLQKRA